MTLCRAGGLEVHGWPRTGLDRSAVDARRRVRHAAAIQLLEAEGPGPCVPLTCMTTRTGWTCTLRRARHVAMVHAATQQDDAWVPSWGRAAAVGFPRPAMRPLQHGAIAFFSRPSELDNGAV